MQTASSRDTSVDEVSTAGFAVFPYIRSIKRILGSYNVKVTELLPPNRRYHQRLCLEGHAPLNRDNGGLLTDTYLHLIDKNERSLSERVKGVA